MNSSGVYLLFGKDEAIDKEAVYIGESENILVRLKQHLKKDFWNESLIIISKDDNLNKAYIRYLEQKMIESAVQFSKDHLFSSASTAASIVLGSSSSGQKLWKLPDGISLSEYESSLTDQQ
ncbi:GIY-YIG nuclease family protein [Heliorestis convoluta]|uniref:GIY-YIG nuclease family protein n=1 Tax=Heliorestis convoluta TaxID=356322 RepID=A0A5Q2N598_9FIRM|nr:GIY-YIG nuclease family protein [Heliorestis convoluta]QGG47420.1 GIY-YIG nuclease family protein [Heliorestis convoluta]